MEPIIVHVYHHFSPGLADVANTKLDQILSRLTAIQATQRQELVMDAATQASIDNLLAKVTESSSTEDSIETLLTGLSAAIADLKKNQTDPAVGAALDAAAALVSGVTARAQAAVVANTPVAPADGGTRRG